MNLFEKWFHQSFPEPESPSLKRRGRKSRLKTPTREARKAAIRAKVDAMSPEEIRAALIGFRHGGKAKI